MYQGLRDTTIDASEIATLEGQIDQAQTKYNGEEEKAKKAETPRLQHLQSVQAKKEAAQAKLEQTRAQQLEIKLNRDKAKAVCG